MVKHRSPKLRFQVRILVDPHNKMSRLREEAAIFVARSTRIRKAQAKGPSMERSEIWDGRAGVANTL